MVCKRCGTVFCDDNGDDSYYLNALRRLYCSKSCKKKAAPSVHGYRKRSPARRRSTQARAKVRYQQGMICGSRKIKRIYWDREEAELAAAARSAETGLPIRVYEHDRCGGWHLTKRPAHADPEGATRSGS